jgi:hypothetical protein
LLDQHAIGDLTFQPFSCQPELCNQLIHKTQKQAPTKQHQENANHRTKRKSSDEQLTVPATSTISPGTSSVAGSIEKQPTRLTLIN